MCSGVLIPEKKNRTPNVICHFSTYNEFVLYPRRVGQLNRNQISIQINIFAKKYSFKSCQFCRLWIKLLFEQEFCIKSAKLFAVLVEAANKLASCVMYGRIKKSPRVPALLLAILYNLVASFVCLLYPPATKEVTK